MKILVRVGGLWMNRVAGRNIRGGWSKFMSEREKGDEVMRMGKGDVILTSFLV